MKIKIDKPFDLDNTVTCGQIFRYEKNDDNSYDIILKDRIINVCMKDNNLIVTSNINDNLKEVVFSYFDLKKDYENIINSIIENDEKIKDAAFFSKGLKMIKQEPFETIISYIISSNNKVSQISKSLNIIAKNYGKKVLFNNKEYYLFPSPYDLKDVSLNEFRECKVGFRDKYLKSIIKKINNNKLDINSFFKLNTQQALEKLMENDGIGPKVASCILLFAYQKYDVFPVDTWVKKIMEKDYDIKGEKNIRDFAKKTYNNYSGIAIQYLFNYSRNK